MTNKPTSVPKTRVKSLRKSLRKSLPKTPSKEGPVIYGLGDGLYGFFNLMDDASFQKKKK